MRSVRQSLDPLMEGHIFKAINTYPYAPAFVKVDAGSPRPTAVISARLSTLVLWSVNVRLLQTGGASSRLFHRQTPFVHYFRPLFTNQRCLRYDIFCV